MILVRPVIAFYHLFNKKILTLGKHYHMKTILLIEDNPEMRENTAEILELANYKVITAENGKNGVELAKKNLPDLVLCDIMMPELDGYGVLYMLLKNSKTATIPFIFLTAKSEKADFRKGMSMGADDYLTKPYEEMELLNAIESRLKKNEIVKKEYPKGPDSLSNFLDDAGSLNDLKNIIQNKRSKTFKKKDVLFEEQEHPKGLYFIAKGKVRTYKINSEGKEFTTGLYGEGDFVGYIALLEETSYTENAIAMEDCEAYILPKEDFITLLYNSREIARSFIKLLSGNVAEKEERLLNTAYNSVRKRVAHSLSMLCKKYKQENQSKTSISITRDELAGIVGTATETVIRTLSEFKEEKLIDIEGRNIVISAPEKLEKLRF